MWTRNTQDSNAGPGQRSVSQASPYPTPDMSKLDPRALDIQIKAGRYESQGKFDEAVKLYKQSLQIQDTPSVKIRLGSNLAKAGHREEALKTLKEVAENHPQTWAGETAQRLFTNIERNPNWGMPKK